jgi:hypothetical protein
MNTPATFDEIEYYSRRPGFLAQLDDATYIKVAKNAAETSNSLLHPQSLVNEIVEIGGRVRQLCLFAIYFADPLWEVPGNKIKNGHSLAQVVGDVYHLLPPPSDPLGGLVEGGVDEETWEQLQKDNHTKGLAFLVDLRQDIANNIQLWRKVPDVRDLSIAQLF